MTRIMPDWHEEEAAWAQGLVAVGMDEVGRGPLAGPLLAAAVAVPPGFTASWTELAQDSKQLTARQREQLVVHIEASGLAWGIGEATVEEIDRWGMTEALVYAMRRALSRLPAQASRVLVDGRPLPKLGPHRYIIDGDACYSIAIASVIAKWRDAHGRLEEFFLAMDLAATKDGDREHQEALAPGPSPIHRRLFITVQQCWRFIEQPKLME
jgi:ribonuclease HII